MASIENVPWPVAVRDVQVHAGTYANCGGFARATADFEPQPEAADGFAFVVALERRPGAYEDDELESWCCENVEKGVRAALTEHFGEALPAVRVVLRRVLVHPVDSNHFRNEEAGRRLVSQALQALPAPR